MAVSTSVQPSQISSLQSEVVANKVPAVKPASVEDIFNLSDASFPPTTDFFLPLINLQAEIDYLGFSDKFSYEAILRALVAVGVEDTDVLKLPRAKEEEVYKEQFKSVYTQLVSNLTSSQESQHSLATQMRILARRISGFGPFQSDVFLLQDSCNTNDGGIINLWRYKDYCAETAKELLQLLAATDIQKTLNDFMSNMFFHFNTKLNLLHINDGKRFTAKESLAQALSYGRQSEIVVLLSWKQHLFPEVFTKTNAEMSSYEFNRIDSRVRILGYLLAKDEGDNAVLLKYFANIRTTFFGRLFFKAETRALLNHLADKNTEASKGRSA